MDLIIIGTDHTALKPISRYTLDLAYGSDENDFELSDTPDITLRPDMLITIDGTEYGGIIDSLLSDGSAKGRTWHGILASKIIQPEPGKDYRMAHGTAGEMLDALFVDLGIASIFQTATNGKGNQTSVEGYQFGRYIDAYAGIRAMLKASGLKLRLEWYEDHIQSSAIPIESMGGTIDSDLIDFDSQHDYHPVNHLIGLGEGELKNRVRSDWYADRQGNVSQKQSLYGLDEVSATYDYSNAKQDELEKETQKKIKELQSQGTVKTTLNDQDASYDIDDVITGRDNILGQTVTASVTKKIVSGIDGIVTVSYEIGQPSKEQTSLSGSAESSPVGGSYTAGHGLTLTGGRFDADVTAEDLASVSQTASDAAKTASGYSAQIGAAQQTAKQALDTAQAKIGSVTGLSPVIATAKDGTVNVAVAEATTTGAGLLSANDKSKLDCIAPHANAYTLPVATTGRLGGIRPDGQTITVNASGVITAHATASPSSAPTWPIGYVVCNTTGRNPGLDFGGTWAERPSLGGHMYERTK